MYILGIDQGTTGSTALIFDASDWRVIGRATSEFPQHFPQPGWVEHDLTEIWQSVGTATQTALAAAASTDPQFQPERITAIGITNQRETLTLFDHQDSRPHRRAIVWQCRRSQPQCQRFRDQEEQLRSRTGLVLDPYFTGTKLSWLAEEEPGLMAKVARGEVLWGTIDSYLLHRLTGGKQHATEPSNASRTLLYNIHQGTWDQDLMAALGLPSRLPCPEIRDSAGAALGTTLGCGFLPDGIPITAILGDQQAALAGQHAFQRGEAKCTYGTGAFLLMQLGDEPLLPKGGLLTTVGWSLAGKRCFALEGAAFVAGAAVQFLRDNLKLIPDAPASEGLAQAESAAPDLYFVPALAGLGAPWWNPSARGAFLGLTRGTTAGQLCRATLEGIAFVVDDLVRAMASELGSAAGSLRVDGGATSNELLLQIQADISERPIRRRANSESTATGAAQFAALGCGIASDIMELPVPAPEREWTPQLDRELAAAQRRGWQRAVAATQLFAQGAS